MINSVLFDRDGTLIADMPHHHDSIVPMPYAREALSRLRERGLRIGVVTNQPNADACDLWRLHSRIEAMLGPIDGWFACTHDVSDGCACRKPQPGLIFEAARAFGVAPERCAMIGDIGSDIEAAHAAGARAFLVPTRVTLKDEVERAPVVCSDLAEAVSHVLAECAP